MNFGWNDQQQMLSAVADRFFRDHYPFDLVRSGDNRVDGQAADMWRKFAGLGWLALPIDEAYGGLGGSPFDIAALCERMGQHLVPEPYLTCGVLASTLIQRSQSDYLRDELLTPIAEGRQLITAALFGSGSDFDLCRPGVRVTKTGSGSYTLHGRKECVPAIASSDGVIVSGLFDPAPPSVSPLGVFFLKGDTPNMTVTSYRMIDGQQSGRLTLESAVVGGEGVLAVGDKARDLLELAADYGNALLVADMVGAIEVLQRMTLEYAATRSQFGRVLAEFQVVKHQLVDMFIAREEARSMMFYASSSLCAADTVARGRAVSAAKASVARRARVVANVATQLHGAIALTEELAVGHYLRRIEAAAATLGGLNYHVGRYGAIDSGCPCHET